MKIHMGVLLRELRKQKGLRQFEVSAKSHVSQCTLSRIEHGYQSLTMDQFTAICRALGTWPSQIFNQWENDGGLEDQK